VDHVILFLAACTPNGDGLVAGAQQRFEGAHEDVVGVLVLCLQC
jgi:hypothetical protein